MAVIAVYRHFFISTVDEEEVLVVSRSINPVKSQTALGIVVTGIACSRSDKGKPVGVFPIYVGTPAVGRYYFFRMG